jgi:excisionase family DNA binding protein
MGKLLSAKEVQDMLGISEATLWRILKRKELTGFKVGHTWRFSEEDIREYIARQRAKATQDDAQALLV